MITANWNGADVLLTEADYATWMDEENLRLQHMAMQAMDGEGYYDE